MSFLNVCNVLQMLNFSTLSTASLKTLLTFQTHYKTTDFFYLSNEFFSSYAARLEYSRGIIKFQRSLPCQQNPAKIPKVNEKIPARITTFSQASHAIISCFHHADPTEYSSIIRCIYSTIHTW